MSIFMNKTLKLFGVGILALAISAGCSNTESQEDAAAIVNEEVISVTKVNEKIENTKEMYSQQGIDVAQQGEEFIEMLEEQVLNSLIDETLVVQAAAEYPVTDEQVNEQVESIKAGFETEEQFNEVLEANNLTNETLLVELEKQLKVEQFFIENMNEVTVSEEELQEAFNQISEMSEEEVDFEEVKPQLEQSVVQQKQQEEQQKLIEKLREDATIEILI